MYFWFDPNTLEWQGFTLIEGQYQPITPNENGYLWSKQLHIVGKRLVNWPQSFLAD